MKHNLLLTLSRAVLAAPVIARGDPFPLVGDCVALPHRRRRQAAAPACVVLAPALAARPAATGVAEVAVGERARSVRLLRACERHVGARRLVPCRQIDRCRRTVVPCHRRVAAGVLVGMSVTHGGYSRSREGEKSDREWGRRKMENVGDVVEQMGGASIYKDGAEKNC